MKNAKLRVTSAQIIVTGTKEKPYYEIKYREVGKENYCIGYSSYCLDNVFEWLEECFDLVEDKNVEQRWIPVSERLPDVDKYILVSFENFTILDIGRYETDKDGSGAFYPGDDDKSYVEYGLFVNAWMPLPEPYRESEPHKQTNADRIRSMTDEELAEVLFGSCIEHMGVEECSHPEEACKSCVLDWLKAESEE